MEIGKTLYVKNRKQWRAWLKKNHKTAKDIWLVYYSKASGKKRIPYNDAVDEALCFGWIDSIVKKISEHSFAQRWSPRRKGSPISELNRERVRRLIKNGKMTRAGLDALVHEKLNKKFTMPKDIEKALKESGAWKNFQKFPASYKRIRIMWIDEARSRPEMFKQRLDYFIKKTKKNQKFGMLQ